MIQLHINMYNIIKIIYLVCLKSCSLRLYLFNKLIK